MNKMHIQYDCQDHASKWSQYSEVEVQYCSCRHASRFNIQEGLRKRVMTALEI